MVAQTCVKVKSKRASHVIATTITSRDVIADTHAQTS